MSADKYLSIFSRQMKAIVYLSSLFSRSDDILDSQYTKDLFISAKCNFTPNLHFNFH